MVQVVGKKGALGAGAGGGELELQHEWLER